MVEVLRGVGIQLFLCRIFSLIIKYQELLAKFLIIPHVYLGCLEERSVAGERDIAAHRKDQYIKEYKE
jgi:hypothetical protein